MVAGDEASVDAEYIRCMALATGVGKLPVERVLDRKFMSFGNSTNIRYVGLSIRYETEMRVRNH